ncbi:reverse transcriptase domain-containing protein, partial [Tanacetum coccineum]
KAFLENYLQQKKCIKDPIELHNIKQQDGESTENFVRRYKLESRDVKGAPECMRISRFLHGITNPELIKRLHDKIPTTMDEMMRVTTSFLRGEVATSNHERKKSFPPWKQQEVVRTPSPYNGIIERSRVRKLQAVLSTVHEMLKIPVEGREEVRKLVEAGIMKEEHYHDWLSNPVMVKKHDGSWKMCVDFKDLNKACPKDGYPLLEIDWKVESLNLEVYVDVFVIKSRTEDEIARDVEESRHTKSNFHWNTEAERSIKQNEAAYCELHMLVCTNEKEKLIVYLAAAKETVCTVLMTERETKKMPIYFVRRALRGPEINYTSMEKLVLALVHASKFLKRYFQEHPIIVTTDQPIQQVLSRLEVAERLQKWSIKLGEYVMHYRPRVSVKGKILGDFIVERPEEDSPDTQMEMEEELPDP